jgi:hypothetical protein
LSGARVRIRVPTPEEGYEQAGIRIPTLEDACASFL